METSAINLEQSRAEFSSRRFLAMPLTGMVVWFGIGIASLFLPPLQSAWVLFIGTGSIFYLALLVSRFTGENFAVTWKSGNPFDSLFMHALFASFIGFAVAIPFFNVDYTSLPLSIGIILGSMWIPLSWIIQHPIGIAHAAVRTVSIVPAWYLFPDHRFFVIPMIIVAVYAFTILILERRWRALQSSHCV